MQMQWKWDWQHVIVYLVTVGATLALLYTHQITTAGIVGAIGAFINLVVQSPRQPVINNTSGPNNNTNAPIQ